MRTAFAVLGVAAAFAFMTGVMAAEKEVTLKGTLLCAKCELQETKKCTNAIKVKEDGKDVVYYLKDKGAKEKYHGKICKDTKEGEVTGTVSEEKSQKYITPKKGGVKFKED